MADFQGIPLERMVPIAILWQDADFKSWRNISRQNANNNYGRLTDEDIPFRARLKLRSPAPEQ